MSDTTSSTTLLFQAPPSAPVSGTDGDPAPPESEHRSAVSPRGRGGDPSSPQLRMLKGARQAAAGMNISDAAIREVLEDPQDVQPDADRPERTRLRRGNLLVTTGQDGTILRVARQR